MNKRIDGVGGELARGGYMRRGSAAVRAFTLVELLIVIALSGLILALLFAPIIQGFHLTSKAKALVLAQDASRNGLEQFSREVSQASYVFDNSETPIVLPLEPADNATLGTATAPKRKSNGNLVYQAAASGGYIVQPREAFGRIDLISSDVVAPTGSTLDPTTNTPVGGADLRVPTAPSSTRYVRYFIGLQRNVDSTGTVAQYYQNLYEFHGSSVDQDFNPFILYRAEYDPNDPNLIDQTLTSSQAGSSGGINDPNFFYNTNAANTTKTNGRTRTTGNGNSYAANWRAISSPVITGTKLDMLIWRRNSNGAIDPNTPFTLGANFAPSSVANDVATPGFLTNAQAEAPSAVPTLYTSQFGAWTFPFTVTILRGSTQRITNPNIFGSITLSFAYKPTTDGTPPSLLLTIPQNSDGTYGTGSLQLASSPVYYAVYIPSSGKYFVSLPNLSFMVDPSRGRIETGLSPLASLNGVPYNTAVVANGTNVQAMTSLPTETPTANAILQGELISTIYRQSTLDYQDASKNVTGATGSAYIPGNQGITFADLQAGALDAVSQYVGYYTLASLQNTIDNIGSFTKYDAPFRPNVTPAGDNAPPGFDGALLVLGSERVVGPDNNLTTSTSTARFATATTAPLLTDYNRVPSGPADLAKNNVGTTTNGSLYTRNSPLSYQFDPRLQLTNEPILEFDTHPANYDTTAATYQPFLIANLPAGLPTPVINSTANPTPPVTEIQVSFLWQNNYARKTIQDGNGTDEVPVDQNGNDQAQATAGTFQPEPDVFQVTYATRSLISVALSARVYDIYSGQPVVAQVTDKVKVNNVGR